MDEPISRLLTRLEKWLAKHRPRFLAGLRPGATTEELAALEKGLGKPIPECLRALLAWHNGQGEDFSGKFEQDWLLMGTERIAAAKQNLDADAAATGWNPAWIPFLDDDAGDYLALDTSQPGQPIRAFWLGNTDHLVVAPSLAAWLKDFVQAVEAGQYVEEPERGTFLRRGS